MAFALVTNSANIEYISELKRRIVNGIFSPHLNYKLRFLFLFCLATIFCYLTAAGTWADLSEIHLFRRRMAGENLTEEIVQNEKVETRDQLYLEYVKMTENMNEFADSNRRKRLPDIIGIGVEKCGTGALQMMLVQHPLILGADLKEVHFFDTEKYNQGLEYYKSFMPEVTNYELAFEKSPGYFLTPVDLPSLIKKSVPKAKLIVVLCDPVNRTFSDFVQEIKMNNIPESVDFEAMIFELLTILTSTLPVIEHDDELVSNLIQAMYKQYHHTHIITAGMYYYHLKRWFKEYDKSDIHVVDGEELMFNPGAAMKKVQDFLGIPKLVTADDFVLGSSGFYCNVTPYFNRTSSGVTLLKKDKPTCMGQFAKGRTRLGNWQYRPSDTVVTALRGFYEPYNKKLFALLGKEFNWK